MRELPNDRRPTTTAPPWEIVAVFDPDGTGQDFAYTVGLNALGHPELHMWARPTDGEDPGHDFKLSSRDMAVGLDRYAHLLLDGELGIGDRHEVDFDEGLTRATFVIGEPVLPAEVDAFTVDPGAMVIPLRWELHRDPIGESQPVPSAIAADIEDLCLDWRAMLANIGGPVHPGAVDADHRQRFGPWSEVIECIRLTAERVAAEGQLSWCIDYLRPQRDQVGQSMAIASALARKHGRSEAFEAALDAGTHDGETFIDLDDDIFADLPRSSASDLLPQVRATTGCILGACYALLVVRDLLDEPRRSLVHDPVAYLFQKTILQQRHRGPRK